MLLDGREGDARQMAQAVSGHLRPRTTSSSNFRTTASPSRSSVLPRLVKLARELDIPPRRHQRLPLPRPPATPRRRRVLMCIQTGKTLSDPGRMRMTTRQLYVKTEAEMRAPLSQLRRDAIARTAEIAARCHVDFDFSTTLPAAISACPRARRTSLAYLRSPVPRRACYSALRPRPRRRARAHGVRTGRHHLDGLCTDYFLIVWDFIHYAQAPTASASAPGAAAARRSIVAYSSGASPPSTRIQYNLALRAHS